MATTGGIITHRCTECGVSKAIRPDCRHDSWGASELLPTWTFGPDAMGPSMPSTILREPGTGWMCDFGKTLCSCEDCWKLFYELAGES